jgi:hypothetical protein
VESIFTKKKVVLAAAILGLRRGELVSNAVDEYIEKHARAPKHNLVDATTTLGVDLNGANGD